MSDKRIISIVLKSDNPEAIDKIVKAYFEKEKLNDCEMISIVVDKDVLSKYKQ